MFRVDCELFIGDKNHFSLINFSFKKSTIEAVEFRREILLENFCTIKSNRIDVYRHVYAFITPVSGNVRANVRRKN